MRDSRRSSRRSVSEPRAPAPPPRVPQAWVRLRRRLLPAITPPTVTAARPIPARPTTSPPVKGSDRPGSTAAGAVAVLASTATGTVVGVLPPLGYVAAP